MNEALEFLTKRLRQEAIENKIPENWIEDVTKEWLREMLLFGVEVPELGTDKGRGWCMVTKVVCLYGRHVAYKWFYGGSKHFDAHADLDSIFFVERKTEMREVVVYKKV